MHRKTILFVAEQSFQQAMFSLFMCLEVGLKIATKYWLENAAESQLICTPPSIMTVHTSAEPWGQDQKRLGAVVVPKPHEYDDAW